nr:hypothetical protein [Candidatus Sigynarchaeota archaeon]
NPEIEQPGESGHPPDDEMMKALGRGPLLPVPPMLTGLLDYSFFQSILQRDENKDSLLSTLQQVKEFISKVLSVHETMLEQIQSRRSLLDDIIDKLSKSVESDFDTIKSTFLANIHQLKNIGTSIDKKKDA